MIAADTNIWIGYFSGKPGEIFERFNHYLKQELVIMPPVVLTELISSKGPIEVIESLICRLPLIEPSDGYWYRVGKLRRSLLQKGRKANLADCMIAQNCIDTRSPLLSLDKDFKVFASVGLKLL